MSIIYQEHSTPYYSIESVNNSFPPHLHREIEIIMVLSGEIEVTIDENVYELKPGDLTISFPNQLHSLNTKNESKILLLLFSADYAHDYATSVSNYVPVCSRITYEDLPLEIIYAVQKAHEYYCMKSDDRLVKSYMFVCIGQLMQILRLTRHEKSIDADITRNLLIYIDTHYTQDLSLDSLAKELGVSRFHISRIFSERLHTSFNEYINRHRVAYAQHLLSTTSASVTDIGFEAGFKSQRSFFRAFKEILDISPLKYRNSL